MNPVLIGNLRTLANNHVLQGYQVHKGVSNTMLVVKISTINFNEMFNIIDASLFSASHVDQFQRIF